MINDRKMGPSVDSMMIFIPGVRTDAKNTGSNGISRDSGQYKSRDSGGQRQARAPDILLLQARAAWVSSIV